ncbi:MAG: hypothetical protein AB7K09_22855 [Planctomycetota bacterium]
MIVVIFAWLGLSYYCYDLAEKNKLLHEDYAKVKYKAVQYTARQNFNRVEQEKLPTQIGFNGKSYRSNDFTMRRTIAELKPLSYAYFTVALDPNRPDQVLDPMGRDDVAPPMNAQNPYSIDKDLQHLGSRLPRGFEIQTSTLYANVQDMEGVIGAQDEFINKLLDANRSLQSALIANHARTNAEHTDEIKKTNDAMVERDRSLEASTRNMLDRVGQADGVEGEFFEQQKELNEFYTSLWSGELIEKLKELNQARREREQMRVKVEGAVEDAVIMAAEIEKTIVERDHYDGTVYYVDNDNRWCYINLGRKDGAKQDMTFNVLRFQHTEAPMQVGIVKVKQVLSDRTSWCDIITTLSATVPIRAGDKIADPGYWKVHPTKYALIGKFGGNYTRYSKQQTTAMLEAAGFTVTPEVNKFTQVVVLGGDFRDDKQYMSMFDEDGKLFEGRTSYKFWRPEELYDFLGRPR